jgi:hypothetical protein
VARQLCLREANEKPGQCHPIFSIARGLPASFFGIRLNFFLDNFLLDCKELYQLFDFLSSSRPIHQNPYPRLTGQR